MDKESVKEFFGKARNICYEQPGICVKCPLNNWCADGIFGANAQEIEDLIRRVEEET